MWKKMILCICLVVVLLGCQKNFKNTYGVFLNANGKILKKFNNYEMLVIDGQNYQQKTIKKLHDQGHIIVSYLNVGSIERFRSYYNEFKDLTFKQYANWEDERWIKSYNPRFEKFILAQAKKLKAKGCDGLFIDNLDVYDHLPNHKMFNGLSKMMKKLRKEFKYVIVNGGDRFVNAYFHKNHQVKDILTGINQETVFTKINFNNDTFSAQNIQESEYYQKYISKYAKQGIQIYLLEYTSNPKIIKKIKNYCQKHKYNCYISDNVNLN